MARLRSLWPHFLLLLVLLTGWPASTPAWVIPIAAQQRLAHRHKPERLAEAAPDYLQDVPLPSMVAGSFTKFFLSCFSVLLLLLGVTTAECAGALQSSLFAPSPRQSITSRGTAPPAERQRQTSLQALSKPKMYSPPPAAELPYPTIFDNTAGAAAFADVLELFPSPRSGGSGLVLLDVGAGPSNEAKRFVERARPNCRVFTADPYNRTPEENREAQRGIEEAGGADVATSMSVLNVIREPEVRAEHIGLVYEALRPGGIAIFKVWAGFWPDRGTGLPSVMDDKYQSNAWASAFLPEVAAIFGQDTTFAANDLNLIVAKKQP